MDTLLFVDHTAFDFFDNLSSSKEEFLPIGLRNKIFFGILHNIYTNMLMDYYRTGA